MLTNCECGDVVAPEMIVCPSCGNSNPGYEGFTFGRRILSAAVGVTIFFTLLIVLMEPLEPFLEAMQRTLGRRFTGAIIVGILVSFVYATTAFGERAFRALDSFRSRIAGNT